MLKVNYVSDSLQQGVYAADQELSNPSGAFCRTLDSRLSTSKTTAAGIMSAKKILDKMQAEYAVNSSAGNPIVKVMVPADNGRVKEQNVFIRGIDTEHATLSEMYALCYYADQIGIGSNNVDKLKSYVEAAEQSNYIKISSAENAFLNRKNWDILTAQMTVHFLESGLYKQAKNGQELLSMFSDVQNLWKDDKKNDWRTMDAKSWDKMMEGLDEFIDAWKEQLRLLREAQYKAAGEAARRAPAAYQAMAAQSAWNAIALLGTLSPISTGTSSTVAANVASMVDAAAEKDLDASQEPLQSAQQDVQQELTGEYL